MKVPQIAPLQGMAPLGLKPRSVDEKTVAERKWQAGLKPKQPQLPCDHGLFGDEHLQLDLVEMLQEPTNEDDTGDWTCIACGSENDETVRYCWHCGCDETGHTADE